MQNNLAYASHMAVDAVARQKPRIDVDLDVGGQDVLADAPANQRGHDRRAELGVEAGVAGRGVPRALLHLRFISAVERARPHGGGCVAGDLRRGTKHRNFLVC